MRRLWSVLRRKLVPWRSRPPCHCSVTSISKPPWGELVIGEIADWGTITLRFPDDDKATEPLRASDDSKEPMRKSPAEERRLLPECEPSYESWCYCI
jgi:hypothetical protein